MEAYGRGYHRLYAFDPLRLSIKEATEDHQPRFHELIGLHPAKRGQGQ